MNAPRLQRGRKAGAGVMAFGIVGLVIGMASPASADPGNGNGTGNGNGNAAISAPAPAVTEDNDTNDGGTPNNVVDAGDNRHPSGKDRSVENGKTGLQGKSGSDPDGMTNGGLDKPGGTGGIDLADQDGNNGCGNDDDFEDDNNGNCGGPERDKDKDDKSKDKPVKSDEEIETENRAREQLVAGGNVGGIGSLGGSVLGTPGTLGGSGVVMTPGTLAAPIAAPAPVASNRRSITGGESSATVLGETFERRAAQARPTTPAAEVLAGRALPARAVAASVDGDVQVLGAEFDRPEALAYTGPGDLNHRLGLLGAGLVLSGLLALVATQKRPLLVPTETRPAPASF